MLTNEPAAAAAPEATPAAAPEATPPVAAAPVGAPPAPAAVTWDQIKAAIPEELRGDKSLETITSIEGLTKSYIHAQKSIGADKLVVPDKHASAEDWQNVFTKLGNPEKIEDYKLSLEGEQAMNEEVLAKVNEAAHAAGVLPWQMEKIVNTFNQMGTEMVTSQNTANDAAYEEEMGSLKKEWGEAYDTQVRKANVAFKELIPDTEQRDAFLKSGLGTDPKVVRLLANAAKLFNEDTFIGHGDGKLGGLTPTDALEKARTIQGDMNHPYRNPAHPNHVSAKKEVRDLYSVAYPEN